MASSSSLRRPLLTKAVILWIEGHFWRRSPTSRGLLRSKLILTASPSALVTTVSAVGKGSKCLALKEAAVVIMITRSQAWGDRRISLSTLMPSPMLVNWKLHRSSEQTTGLSSCTGCGLSHTIQYRVDTSMRCFTYFRVNSSRLESSPRVFVRRITSAVSSLFFASSNRSSVAPSRWLFDCVRARMATCLDTAWISMRERMLEAEATSFRACSFAIFCSWSSIISDQCPCRYSDSRCSKVHHSPNSSHSESTTFEKSCFDVWRMNTCFCLTLGHDAPYTGGSVKTSLMAIDRFGSKPHAYRRSAFKEDKWNPIQHEHSMLLMSYPAW
mmetsp:Transcript_17266/g.30813  ORF Transcript_17266/g.30813 Transcript_17266/m.30813 type:complete len:327 (-) Transcript_17266:186-1166(-)